MAGSEVGTDIPALGLATLFTHRCWWLVCHLGRCKKDTPLL